MSKKVITTIVKPLGHYSQGIKTEQFIFTAQVGHIDPASGKELATVEEQTAQTLENIEKVLEAGGSTLEDVVSTTVFLPDINDFQKMNEVWKKFFPKEPPSRATVSARLVSPKMLVEVQAIALSRSK